MASAHHHEHKSQLESALIAVPDHVTGPGPAEVDSAPEAAPEFALRPWGAPAVARAPLPVFLRRMTRWQADLHRAELATLHLVGNTWRHGTAYDEYRNFLTRLSEHAGLTGFDLILAENTETVGMAYGARLDRSGAFWRHFADDLPDALDVLTAQGQVFAVLELMVLPAYRRQGIARRLLSSLLDRSGSELATALVSPDNEAGHAAYLAWGWARIGRLGPPDGTSPYDVLVAQVPRKPRGAAPYELTP
ncbi:hypothetical protein GCM10010361_28900 [Streptomyces olivaceiscleroticus]|uniref:N-acetyltransferase domain-containing protein n=1 Tax=Streptomyces olivaceiscleroticus TaxID=68245 RepID=A0ABN0ZYM1_9ACTN